jgi:sugar lactone lactonase YvrE
LTPRTLAVAGVILGLAVLGSERVRTQTSANAARQAPRFEAAAGWLKLPNNWVMGVVSAVAVDRHDNVWILHRPRDVAEAQRANMAPSVLEFDSSGKFLQAWGWPVTKELWPGREHCMYVDADDNVWIGGTWRSEKESDDYIQKFDSKGKLLLQIGQPNASKGPTDTANVHGAADLFVYAKTREVFVADEGNLRLIVFDANTGAFKRMWTGAGSPWGATHAVQVSDDGIVYVGDRANRRIQLFSVDGKFLKEVTDVYASGLTFSRDPEQRFMYIADSTGSGVEQIVVMDRKNLTVVSRFGKEGTAPGEFQGPHVMSVDSKNNLYVTEVAPGNRLQKFLFKGVQ